MARDIYEHLGTYGPDEKLLFDKTGMLLPARGKYWWVDHLARMISQRVMRRRVQRTKAGGRRKGEPEPADEAPAGVPFVPIAIGVGVLGLLLLGTILILRTPKGTVVVEIDEPNAVVSVDDGKLQFTTTEDDQSIELKLKKGEHTVTVTKDGFEPYSRQLLVKKGQKETIRIGLASASIQETGEAPTTPVVTQAGGTPPLAIAPFDAAQAKKHQQAWAKHLGVPVEMTNSIGMKLVLIPPGEFMMGSSAEERDRPRMERPQHRVRITRPFRLGRHEVTVGQFRQFVNQTGYKTEAEKDGKGGLALINGKGVQDPRFVWTNPGFPQTDDHPVVHVSWNDAMAFCQWLSDKEGAEFVLPSEAQWEYACRAGTTTAWYYGDSERTLEEYGWFDRNSDGKTHPTGQLKPNGWSLYDVHGNVREWCADWWATDYYAQSPPNDPAGPTTGSDRVTRGGNWSNTAGICRSAHRVDRPPEIRNSRLGFRLACEIPTASPGGPTPPRAVAGLRKGGDNYALEFGGKPDCVEIPTLKYDGSHPITIEATVRLDSGDPNSGVVSNVAYNRRPQAGTRLMSHGPSKTWAIGIQRGGTWYHLDWDDLDRDRWPKTEVGQTIRLAGVWDGKEVSLFTNGQRLQMGTVPQPRAGDAEITSLFIGADPGDAGGTAGHFIGMIDEVRISNIARYDKDFTPQERLEPDQHTLALYHFDEGRGDVLHDTSGNGHHGKIVGAKWVRFASRRQVRSRRSRAAAGSPKGPPAPKR